MVKQFSFIVDKGKPMKLKHSTAGSYQVAAKNEKEARKMLQKAIGFGSIGKGYEIPEELFRDDYDMSGAQVARWKLPYGEVRKFYWTTHEAREAKHATDKID